MNRGSADQAAACLLRHEENMLMQSGMLDTLWSALLFDACICMFAVCGQPDGCSNLVIMSWIFLKQAMTAVLHYEDGSILYGP